MATEIRWTSGKEEYDVKEIEYMLQSQRAMIYNDVNRLMTRLKGTGARKSEDEMELMSYLKNPRKVEI